MASAATSRQVRCSPVPKLSIVTKRRVILHEGMQWECRPAMANRGEKDMKNAEQDARAP
jgi:hypothetical protein